jgi:hypothetical protein
VYDDGLHVDKSYNDQSYRLVYDNKRRIIEASNSSNSSLLDSIP